MAVSRRFGFCGRRGRLHCIARAVFAALRKPLTWVTSSHVIVQALARSPVQRCARPRRATSAPQGAVGVCRASCVARDRWVARRRTASQTGCTRKTSAVLPLATERNLVNSLRQSSGADVVGARMSDERGFCEPCATAACEREAARVRGWLSACSGRVLACAARLQAAAKFAHWVQ